MSLTAPVLPASVPESSLLEGDTMTSEEFIRRWEEIPDLKHAELIEGIVYISSPMSRTHGLIESTLNGWLNVYAMSTPGCEPGLEGTWLMESRAVPQPDIALSLIPEYGGQLGFIGIYSSGAPELIVEVAVSSRSREFGVKKRLYERMGVREYVIAVARTEELVWYGSTPEGFQPLAADDDGILRSRVFPGLWLDPGTLWKRDLPRIAAVVREGIASPEHAAFTAELTARYNRRPPADEPQ